MMLTKLSIQRLARIIVFIYLKEKESMHSAEYKKKWGKPENFALFHPITIGSNSKKCYLSRRPPRKSGW